jgi:hypothetical protein
MRLHVSIDDKALIERYRQHFTSQGGNDLLELMERPGVNYFNNPVVAEMQGGCWAQLGMLKSLLAAGLLKEVL